MTIAFNVHEFLKNRISKSAPFWPENFPSITSLLPQLLEVNYKYYLNIEIVLLLLVLLLDCLLLLPQFLNYLLLLLLPLP